MELVLEPIPLPLEVEESDTVRVGGTRVTLDSVMYAYQAGASAEEIVADYPALELADVYAVISYYLRHKAEVDAYLAQREQEAVEIRKWVETWSPQAGIRERLLARWAAQERGDQ